MTLKLVFAPLTEPSDLKDQSLNEIGVEEMITMAGLDQNNGVAERFKLNSGHPVTARVIEVEDAVADEIKSRLRNQLEITNCKHPVSHESICLIRPLDLI